MRRGCGHYRNGHCDHQDKNNYMALSDFPEGSKCEVIHLHGCTMNNRLANLGIGVGSVLTIVQNAGNRGPLIIMLESTRYAIGRGMARLIECKKVESCEQEND
ncbi:MAG TPA: FeoA family protein [Caldisericia bacterium]|nr:FeoA family protein [Caldisericia bacterium]HPF48495.1 FeoA family protein [Caldisericia bacterium]HPI83324.1 FeoA family protein [Caldisericia bacterium]HPQ92950.1 FeoA family protein [Caldisericia bacterium]HRV75216.1 FeoA family protein [Caldisericia bacterium]